MLVIGEALIDIVRSPDGEETEHVGGSPANVAMGLAALGHETTLATWLALDARGTRIRDHLQEWGVQIAEASFAAVATSTALATLGPDGAATYDFDLDWSPPPVQVSQGTHVHTGSIAATLQPGAERVREAMSRGRDLGTVSYDPNLRPSIMGEAHDVRSRVEECVGLADVVKASDEDLEWLYSGAPVEEVAHLWGLLGPSVVVVTRGGDGALVHVSSIDEAVTVEATPVQVEDTVGAGDSFMAGLLSALLDAGLAGPPAARQALRQADVHDFTTAVRRAIATAAYTVQRAGAAAPTRADL